jgi:DNA-binding NarL/FixJ family response regulator
LVDDHLPLLVELPALLTRHAGFVVLTAATVEEALAALADNAVDVVVADLWLRRGGPDGGSLLDTIASWYPSVGRVLLSADGLGATIARECGHAFHDKSDSVAKLVELIRNVAKR